MLKALQEDDSESRKVLSFVSMRHVLENALFVSLNVRLTFCAISNERAGALRHSAAAVVTKQLTVLIS